MDRVKGSWWTGKDIKYLKELWDRRRNGERTVDLAAELGVTPTHLSKLWAQFGMDPEKERIHQRRKHLGTGRVHAWRFHEAITYGECCERLGIEPTKANQHKLRQAHKGYCTRNRAPWPDRAHIKKVREGRLSGD